MTQSDGVVMSRGYDSLGRLASSNDSTGTVGYGYDLANNLKTITYPGSKTVTRDFDDAGRMTSSTDWLANTTTFGFEADNSMKTTDLPGAQLDSFNVDAAGRLMNTAVVNGATNLMTLDYARSSSGLLTGESVTGAVGSSSRTWDYDAIDQLTSQNSVSTWAYDKANNVSRVSDGRTQAFTAGGALCATSRVASVSCATADASATTYGYDAVGMPLTDPVAGAPA